MIKLHLAFAALFICLLAIPTAEAKQKCTRLVKTLRGEQLINSCSSCRIVQLQRKRPSSAAPINRTYTLAQNTTTDLSFRGPGQSRILSDSSCRPSANYKAPTAAQKAIMSDGKQCIIMQRADNNGVTGLALANTCKECRMAVVDRINGKGERRSQSIAISGRSLIPIAALGAMQAAILDDQPCK